MRWPALALAVAAAWTPAGAAELEAGYGRDRLTGGRSDWQVLSLGAAWTRQDRARVEAGLLGQERFGLRDSELRAAAATPLGAGWTLGVELTGSPTHQVVPAWSAALEAGDVLAAGLLASARARWSRYLGTAGQVDAGLASLSLERYLGAWRAGAAAYGTAVRDSVGGSLRLFVDRFYRERGRLGISVSGGRELDVVEASPALAGPAVQVRGLRSWSGAVAGVHELDPAWALTWEVGFQRLPGLYTRTGARLGVRLRL